jgi:hypothetical protein
MTAWQRLLLAFTLLAFGVQSYVTQTHIHLPSEFAGAASTAAAGNTVAERTGHHDRYPANEDPANCPLCQEIFYAGHYVAPVAIMVLAPNFIGAAEAAVERELGQPSADSHNWQGRAPPRI